MDNSARRTNQKLIDIALETLTNMEATGDVIFHQEKTLSLSAEKGRISKYQLANHQLLGVRSIKNNKVGISYCEHLIPTNIKKTVMDAITTSIYGDEDEFEVIDSDINRQLARENKSVDHSTLAEEKINFALELENAVLKKDPRAKSAPYNGLSQVESTRIVANTAGACCVENNAYFSCYTSCLAESNLDKKTQSKKAMFYKSDVGSRLSDLNFEMVIEESVQHALDLLEGMPVATGKYDLIFSPDVFGEFFSVFSSVFSGKKAMEGVNPWRHKLGEQVAVNALTLTNHPRHSLGLFPLYFDGEGRATSPVSLIENGELKNLLHNTKTARYFKVAPTGSAIRGVKSSLDVSPHQLVIQASDSDGLTNELKKGLYLEIVTLSGLHSGVNPVSGQFSFGASGYLWRDNQKKQAVKDITISGNFFQTLKKIKCIGSVLFANSSKDFIAPLIRFADVSVAGS